MRLLRYRWVSGMHQVVANCSVSAHASNGRLKLTLFIGAKIPLLNGLKKRYPFAQSFRLG